MFSLRVGAVLATVLRCVPEDLLVQSVRSNFGESTVGAFGRLVLTPLRSADVTIPHGECAGVRFNAGGSAPSFALGTTEPEVQVALASMLKTGHVFYDIGANVGFYTVLGAKQVGPTGHVYAFEPILTNVVSIHRNVDLSRFTAVTVLPRAVGDHCGPVTLTTSREPFWARLSTLPPPPHLTGKVAAHMITIDDVVETNEAAPPNVIKIDVEGAEAQVLTGMAKTLCLHRPSIVCELHATQGEVGRLLAAMGYSMRPLWRRVRGRMQESRHIVAQPRERT
jgi:FkbM family methyltransferase